MSGRRWLVKIRGLVQYILGIIKVMRKDDLSEDIINLIDGKNKKKSHKR